MLDIPIDPELRVRGTPERVLQRTSDAVSFAKQMALAQPDGPWSAVIQAFEHARDEWTAIEAVVQLELALEADGRLIEDDGPLRARAPSLAKSA
jgi:hypothetical protein